MDRNTGSGLLDPRNKVLSRDPFVNLTESAERRWQDEKIYMNYPAFKRNLT